jgi:ABC transporter with metal-binding/Fe-S-binding domain ATP-binding protein
MDVAALISGGKDSALALYRALEDGYKVKYLVTVIPEREDSWMFHYPNTELTNLFAESTGIPLAKTWTNLGKEEELRDLKRLLSNLDVEGVISGAVSSEYQKNRIDKVCGELGLKSIAPLWCEEPIRLMNEIIGLGFDVIIVGVYAYGFNRKWLGRRIDEEALKDLIELSRRFQVSIVGEGGEYETFVLDAPYFKRRIQVVRAKVVWKADAGHLIIEEARLEDKA